MARRRKSVPLRTRLRRLEKKADKALSLLVRAETADKYGACPLCKVGKIECCFHFVRRRRKSVRWDRRNVIGACHRCNYIEYRDPDQSRAWYIRNFGAEQYLAVVDKSAEQFVPAEPYLKAMVGLLELKLENYRAGQKTEVDRGDQDAA